MPRALGITGADHLPKLEPRCARKEEKARKEAPYFGEPSLMSDCLLSGSCPLGLGLELGLSFEGKAVMGTLLSREEMGRE